VDFWQATEEGLLFAAKQLKLEMSDTIRGICRVGCGRRKVVWLSNLLG